MSTPKDGHSRFNSIRAAVAVLALAAGVAGLSFGWRWLPKSALAQARAAYARGDWAAAGDHARRALSARKDDPEALRLLARSAARLGREDAAIAIYTRRLDERALEAEDDFLLGLAFERRGQTDLAARTWKKLVDASSPAPRWLEELGRYYLQGHRSEEAIRVADLLSRQKGWEARGSMMLGMIRAALQDVPGARIAFRRALDADPTEVDQSADPGALRKLIARTFLRSGEPGVAQGLVQSVLDHGPDAEAAWLLSRVFIQQGNKTLAQQAIAQAGSYRANHPLEPEPSPFVGEGRCAKCHETIFQHSLASRHTQSFYRGEQLAQLPLPERPLNDPDDPSVTHSFTRKQGAIHQETRVGEHVFETVIEYAFGTVDRYVTMLARDAEGTHRICRSSYFDTAEGKGWDRTVLDAVHPTPTEPEQFQGLVIGVRDGLARCLYCHVTNPRTVGQAGAPEGADRAIGCERCHGPGANHLAALALGLVDQAIVSPAAASLVDVTNRQCNDCHILDRNFRNDDLSLPGWMRSQGVGWTMSRCNTRSAGAFGCVTCHDPHRAARATPTGDYEAKCLKCHTSPAPAPAPPPHSPGSATARPTAEPKASACPVSPAKGCLGCHMPRVKFGPLHTDLTDHYIRIDRK